jgi:hypothetical protein
LIGGDADAASSAGDGKGDEQARERFEHELLLGVGQENDAVASAFGLLGICNPVGDGSRPFVERASGGARRAVVTATARPGGRRACPHRRSPRSATMGAMAAKVETAR